MTSARRTRPAAPDGDGAVTPVHRLLHAIGRTQWVAVDVTGTWARMAGSRLPAVPGFRQEMVTGPADITDTVFASVEDALGDRLPIVRDVVHQQGAFVAGMFASLQPVVDALAGDAEGGTPGAS